MTVFLIACGVSVVIIVVSTLFAMPQERQDDQHRRNWPFI